jgi:hypothetical protein
MADDLNILGESNQLRAWLESRKYNAERVINHPNTNIHEFTSPELSPKEFSSRLMDFAYRPGHGANRFLQEAQRFDSIANTSGGSAVGFAPYSQADFTGRMISEQDPNFWIGKRLFLQDQLENRSNLIKNGEIMLSEQSYRDWIEETKKIEENVSGLQERQKGIQALRNKDARVNGLATSIEDAAGELSTSELKRMNILAQIENLKKLGLPPKMYESLIRSLNANDSTEMILGRHNLSLGLTDALDTWNTATKKAGLDHSEFIPHKPLKLSVGLVPNPTYKGMGPVIGTLGKTGGFLLNAAPQTAGLTGFVERILNGGEWMGNPATGEFDVMNKSEMEDQKQLQRLLYGPQPGDIM